MAHLLHYIFTSSLFFRTAKTWLTLDWFGRPDWPQAQRSTNSSLPQMLGLKVGSTTHGSKVFINSFSQIENLPGWEEESFSEVTTTLIPFLNFFISLNIKFHSILLPGALFSSKFTFYNLPYSVFSFLP